MGDSSAPPQGGDRRIYVVWAGQLVSLLGSGLTSFALGLWVYQQTGSVTPYAMIALCTVVPRLLLSPLAGIVVDRWNRRWVMILSDAGAALGTLVLALLLWGGHVSIWYIYLITLLNAACGAFQAPAYASAIPLFVPKEEYGRINGLVQLAQAAADIVTPALSGLLLVRIQLQGILWIDWATFLFAATTLLFIRFPERAAKPVERPPLRRDALFGWRYIAARPGLSGLLLFLVVSNFLWGLVGALVVPMVAAFASPQMLGAVVSIAGGGMLAGSLAMGVWGRRRRYIYSLLGFELLSGVSFLLMGLRPAVALVAVGAFLAHATIAVTYGSNQAIWQSQVPLEAQGRVLSTQQMLAKVATPIAYLLAGPLAERVFEPLLSPQGTLAGSVGAVIGVGTGRGIGLIFLAMGLLKIVVALGGWLSPAVREVEGGATLPGQVRHEF